MPNTEISSKRTEDILQELKEIENKIFNDTFIHPFYSPERDKLEVYKSKLQAELVLNRGYKMKKGKIIAAG